MGPDIGPIWSGVTRDAEWCVVCAQQCTTHGWTYYRGEVSVATDTKGCTTGANRARSWSPDGVPDGAQMRYPKVPINRTILLIYQYLAIYCIINLLNTTLFRALSGVQI